MNNEALINNWFENHTATMEYQGNIQVIEWREPGTRMYSVKYVLDGSNVFVTGDLGTATFRLTESATIHNLARYAKDYFIGKLVCAQHGTFSFDIETARKHLREWKQEIDEEELYYGSESIPAFYDYLMTHSKDITHEFDWKRLVELAADAVNVWYTLDSEDLSCICEYGQELDINLIAYYVGLQRACSELIVQEALDKIPELEASIFSRAGTEFNIQSDKQVGVVLFEKLKLVSDQESSTEYSITNDLLKKLQGQHPIVEELLQYRTYLIRIGNHKQFDERAVV
ncbi:DNA polymerase [Culicoidibacter larvae]|uniref:DNA-directed DNA polymerase n=1 Tax=Culicoidibacter larvae TaxID=2579976 RepID=A0A5R8QH14_9FIRM|nr:DNA polymerase [Culicoidibacter larvae]TLG77331.1 hypothetical protein FEZ08_01555 [Culicoidibacter larvae]